MIILRYCSDLLWKTAHTHFHSLFLTRSLTMSPLDLLVLLFSLQLTFASPIVEKRVPSFVFDGDAPFSVSPDDLAASLTCPYGNPTAASPPVLLVHGTATTGQESWGDGYVPALKANGFTACYITIRKFAISISCSVHWSCKSPPE